MNYQFDAKEACIYGVDGAILISNFRFWILKNKANNKHFYDGRFWTYNSAKALAEVLPFYTHRQIERILKELVEKKVLIKGNYNTKGYDKTNWYAFVDEKAHLNAPEPSRKRVNHSHERVNGDTQTRKPIPDTNTDNKTNKDSADAPPELFSKAANLNKGIVHQDYVDGYWQWYEEKVGEPPRLLEQDYKALKNIRKYLTDAKKGDETKALSSWLYILSSWGKLEDFLQKQVKPTQIDSNMANIRLQLREQLEKDSKSTKKMIM